MNAATGRRRWLAFAALAATVWVADQVSKAWIEHTFGGAGRPVPVIGDLVRITISHNSGGIFGLLGGSAPILAIGSLVVVGLLVFYMAREGTRGHPLLTVALGLLLGGALGNLTDRVRWGYVLDFVDAGIGDLRWYTFNVADSAISVSIVLLVALAFFGDRLPGGARVATAEPAPGSAAQAGGS